MQRKYDRGLIVENDRIYLLVILSTSYRRYCAYVATFVISSFCIFAFYLEMYENTLNGKRDQKEKIYKKANMTDNVRQLIQ